MMSARRHGRRLDAEHAEVTHGTAVCPEAHRHRVTIVGDDGAVIDLDAPGIEQPVEA
jgi:hypothetical protein